VGWGSTFGAIHQAVRRSLDAGLRVSHIHIRHLAPFPINLGDLLRRFGHVLVPELNNGQLVHLLRDQFLVPAVSLPKVTGRPFQVTELERAIRAELEK
jgi:2-oxoglutarate ferredoxin oxidoreductase subunit alpha